MGDGKKEKRSVAENLPRRDFRRTITIAVCSTSNIQSAIAQVVRRICFVSTFLDTLGETSNPSALVFM
jgi:hypothetical protein